MPARTRKPQTKTKHVTRHAVVHVPPVPTAGAHASVKQPKSSPRLHELPGTADREARLRLLLETTSDIIITVGLDGRITYINMAGIDTFGYAEHELLGKSIEMLLPLDQLTTIRQRLAARREGETRSFVHIAPALTKFGRTIPLELRASPILLDGSISEVIINARDISERKRVEESVAYQARVLANVNDAIVGSDSHYRLNIWNAAAEAMYGWKADEVIGSDGLQFLKTEWQGVDAEHMRRTIAEQGHWRGEATQCCKDGSRIHVEIASMVLHDSDGRIIGYISVNRDVTDRKRAEERLRESEEKFKYVFDHSPVGKSISRPEGGVTVNEAFARMLGYSTEELAALDWKTITHPDDVAARQAEVERLVSGQRETVRLMQRYLKRDGGILWGDTSMSIRRQQDGSPLYFITAVTDVSESEQSRLEIRKLNDSLAQHALDLESANAELESFAYSVSHDLRAPLRHIDGFVELLQQRLGPSLDDKSAHYLETVAGSARQMGVLIDDLLTFSRMGRNALQRVPVNLGDLVMSVIAELAPEAEARKVEWSIGDLPCVEADPSMLRLALVNLISNAIKFTRKVDRPCIEIGTTRSDGDEMVFFVRDNGVGFEMAYVDKLFKVFQRLHRSEDFEGTGIGLANVRRIINRHGGRTWAEGSPDEGATFYFSLPVGNSGL